MKHIKWICSIHLLREGELSHDEERALNEHLIKCENCSAVYEQIQLDWVKVMGEIAADPVIAHTQQLGENVLTAIEQQEVQSHRRQRATPSVRAPLFNIPKLQLGLQVASLVLLALFLVEQFQVTNSVRILEVQLRNQGAQSTQATVNILPARFKTRVLEGLKIQLNKRGWPSHRIEVVIKNLNLQAYDRGSWNRRLVVRLLDRKQESPLFKRLNQHWRQP